MGQLKWIFFPHTFVGRDGIEPQSMLSSSRGLRPRSRGAQLRGKPYSLFVGDPGIEPQTSLPSSRGLCPRARLAGEAGRRGGYSGQAWDPYNSSYSSVGCRGVEPRTSSLSEKRSTDELAAQKRARTLPRRMAGTEPITHC